MLSQTNIIRSFLSTRFSILLVKQKRTAILIIFAETLKTVADGCFPPNSIIVNETFIVMYFEL